MSPGVRPVFFLSLAVTIGYYCHVPSGLDPGNARFGGCNSMTSILNPFVAFLQAFWTLIREAWWIFLLVWLIARLDADRRPYSKTASLAEE